MLICHPLIFTVYLKVDQSVTLWRIKKVINPPLRGGGGSIHKTKPWGHCNFKPVALSRSLLPLSLLSVSLSTAFQSAVPLWMSAFTEHRLLCLPAFHLYCPLSLSSFWIPAQFPLVNLISVDCSQVIKAFPVYQGAQLPINFNWLSFVLKQISVRVEEGVGSSIIEF